MIPSPAGIMVVPLRAVCPLADMAPCHLTGFTGEKG